MGARRSLACVRARKVGAPAVLDRTFRQVLGRCHGSSLGGGLGTASFCGPRVRFQGKCSRAPFRHQPPTARSSLQSWAARQSPALVEGAATAGGAAAAAIGLEREGGCLRARLPPDIAVLPRLSATFWHVTVRADQKRSRALGVVHRFVPRRELAEPLYRSSLQSRERPDRVPSASERRVARTLFAS